MQYIYDILLNFKEKFYDFYDWDHKDSLEHIRKIPLLLVTTETLYDILHYDIKVDFTSLKIENKTEKFWGRKTKSILHACLLTDSKKVIGIKEQDGKILVSDLFIPEEELALELAPTLERVHIMYQKKKKEDKILKKTRKQEEAFRLLMKKIDHLRKEKNIEKLKYIYYECFSKKEEKKEKMILELENSLEKNFSQFSVKMDQLLKKIEKTV